jgi:transketolase
VAQPVTMDTLALDELCINTIRTLSMDAVQAADSGHPGTPMALAPLGYVLWTRYLRHDPSDPSWPDRDRFVLSCGHASMLLYSLLYLTGYDLSLDDIKQFRQLGSRTPGHPEYGVTPGVETTTGPLGQGIGNAVGMALAEAHLAATFNRGQHRVVDHWTYFVASDGDLMEGVSHEAASLAGYLGLGKLIGVYDDNRITIDGSTDLTCRDDPVQRFEAYGWHVLRVEDGNDLGAIDRALESARGESSRPSLIVLRTHIAYGSPNKQDTAAAHGSALGEEEVALTKKQLDWPSTGVFFVPDDALEHWRKCVTRGARLHEEWKDRFRRYQTAHSNDAAEFERRVSGSLPKDWETGLPTFEVGKALATRNASGKVLNALAARMPELIGGSADLAGSVKTELIGLGSVAPGNAVGRNIHFGVREHAMGSMLNGMALHRGTRPFGGTFLVFSDYMRPAIRLAALMGLPTIYIFSHDSIGLGEDGPTHQPIETLAALRAIPGLHVIRPADANETVDAWRVAIRRSNGPVALILTRQSVPTLPPRAGDDVARGGYVLSPAPGGEERGILLASGSEVSLALEAQARLAKDGIAVRVVSMPCLELFGAQSDEYRGAVLPPHLTVRVAVEAAHPMPWYRWIGDGGATVTIERFGESGPYQDVYRALGITVDHVVGAVRALIDR